MKNFLLVLMSLIVSIPLHAASPAPQWRGDQPSTNTASTTSSDSIDNRLSKLERLMESQALLELSMKLEQLQREVSALRGQMEEIQHNNKQILILSRSKHIF